MTVGFIYKPMPSQGALQKLATQLITTHLKNALDNDGQASLFLSGGSTPGPIYESLSTVSLPWDNVNVGLVDERWVNEEDTGSNAALVRKTLLQHQATSARFQPMKSHHETAARGQTEIETSYADIVSPNSFAVLGMGLDGHTASWFPKAQGMELAVDPQNQNTVQAIMAKPSSVTGSYLERMTLTLSALLKCEKILLLITGQDKRNVLDDAIETGNPDLPVSHLLKQVAHMGGPDKLTILLAP